MTPPVASTGPGPVLIKRRFFSVFGCDGSDDVCLRLFLFSTFDDDDDDAVRSTSAKALDDDGGGGGDDDEQQAQPLSLLSSSHPDFMTACVHSNRSKTA